MDKITITEIGIHLLGEMPVTCVFTHEGGMLVKDARYKVHSFTAGRS